MAKKQASVPVATSRPTAPEPAAPKKSPPQQITAVEMGARQREISVSEFFTKNRHLLGFDNPRKALLTCVKEAVDNALDACEEAGITRAAVRSSAVGEDSADSSMAGMFRTELDVATPHVNAAIGRVRDSYGGRMGGVVVQQFRAAEWSGVLFTVDPAHAGRMLVELVEGGCDALVSGRATPKSYRFGRATGEQLGGEKVAFARQITGRSHEMPPRQKQRLELAPVLFRRGVIARRKELREVGVVEEHLGAMSNAEIRMTKEVRSPNDEAWVTG